MKVDSDFLKKYNTSGPRYTSYPPATFFSNEYTNIDLKESVVLSNNENPSSISIYIHIPFCPQICHFCGCTTESGYTKPFLERYVDAVIKEIELVAQDIDKSRILTQIHWGGGTPNAIDYKYIKQITDCIKENFIFSSEYEMAIECSPAYFTFKHISLLKEYGFNRISLGIQDFRDEVLNAINRKPSKLKIEDIIGKIKEEGFTGTNIDLVYGLPLQTVDSFNETVDRAIKLDTDRIVTFSYAHVPSVITRQKVLDKIGFPSADEKARMYQNAYDKFIDAGYVAIGMDHFAKPHDELAIALTNKNLHRNFQGYCTRATTGQVYGFGASSISQLHSAYSQNEKNAAKYIKRIKDEGLAVIRGYSVNENEKIVRAVINSVMCNYFVDFNLIAQEFKTSIEKIYAVLDFTLDKFKDFIEDDLMQFKNDTISVNLSGRLVIRNIVMKFDPMLNTGVGTYSQTI
jgi:oxygen-independent coproporphyrinogen-3 oxidase|tara:strand:+ start:2011 stop:3387 length:1377 start_codon:yes stop_codon:yes gene_type:complete